MFPYVVLRVVVHVSWEVFKKTEWSFPIFQIAQILQTTATSIDSCERYPFGYYAYPFNS